MREAFCTIELKGQSKRVIHVMEGTRRQGHPRSRWIDEVKENQQQMGIRNWRNVAKDREE